MRFIAHSRLACIFSIALAAGCANNSNRQPSPGDEGWTLLGSVTVSAEQDRSVLRAEHLPDQYRSICIEANAPVVIERLALSFTDTSTFQAEQQIVFDGPDRRVIDMPGDPRKILHVMLVHSGGRTVLGTTITIWVR